MVKCSPNFWGNPNQPVGLERWTPGTCWVSAPSKVNMEQATVGSLAWGHTVIDTDCWWLCLCDGMLFCSTGEDSVMLKEVFMEQILCQMYIFCYIFVRCHYMTSNYLHLQSNRRTQQQTDTGIRPWGTFFKDSTHIFFPPPKSQGWTLGFQVWTHPFCKGKAQNLSVIYFVVGSTAVPFQTDLGFDWITLPFHHLGCIGVSQNSIGRLNVELRQSLSADINTEPLGLCVGRICWGHGHFQGSRRWGILSPQCKVLRRGPWRIATLRTRGRRCDTWLGKQETSWICLFPEHDEDVDYILSCCWNMVKYVTTTTGVFVWCL